MRSRLFTVIMVVAVAIALTATLLTSYDSRNKADCQTTINTQFLEVQKVRAKINDQDRAAVATLLDDLLVATTAEQRAAAQAEYKSTQTTLTQLRDDNPLPKKISCDYDNPIRFGDQ